MARQAQQIRTVSVVGTGSYVPERIVTNADLEKKVDTSDEWIMSRTGIRERRVAAPDQATSDLAAEAARRALADADIPASEVDMIIVATLTPDMPFPNTACFVQDKIGASKAFCFSLEAACSGFIFAMDTARQFLGSGRIDTALVIGAETMSRVMDWDDRATCVLFGDGAGAAVLKADQSEEGGLLCSVMGSDGSLAGLLNIPAGGSRCPASEQTLRDHMHFLKMGGREVFRHAVTNMTAASREALAQCGLEVADIDCVIPHQANMRIIKAIGQRLEIPPERFFINLDRYGNTSAASIILALDEAVKQGVVTTGNRILTLAFGGGFTWGASVLRWDKV